MERGIWPQPRSRGATITEYAFIGILIMAVCVTAVMTMGGNLNQTLASLKGDLKSHSDAAVQVIGTMEDNQKPNINNPPEQGPVLPTGTLQNVCFQSGYCVDIPYVGGNTATTGTMGGELTESFANVLSQIAQQMAEKGADPSLVADTTQLAQYGHWLGDDHTSIDGFFSKYPPGADGVYPPYLVDYIKKQYADHNTNVDAIADAFNNELASINQYVQQNPGALPPEMLNVVNSQAAQIQSLQTMYTDRYNIHTQAQQYIQGGMSEAEAYSKAFANYQQKVESLNNGGALTHQSANTICSNGGNTGVCIQTP